MAQQSPKRKRKYKKSEGENSEYKYQSKPAQKHNRMLRNKANREAKEDGRIAKGDGNAVHHVDGNPRNNRRSNLRVVGRSYNASRNA